MPPLKSRLRSGTPEGFAAQTESSEALPRVKDSGRVLGANPFIRCPLPPFNSSPDSLRQFEENGKIPARRVIPLPVATQVGGNTTIVNQTSAAGSGGGSSSSGTIPVTAKTVTLDCPTMNPGDVFPATITIAKVAALMILTSSDPCEIRVYGDPATQTSDIGRQADNSPQYEVTPGLVSDVVFDTNPFTWNWQNRLFVNQDSPATTNLYITVFNVSGGVITPSVTLTYLPLE